MRKSQQLTACDTPMGLQADFQRDFINENKSTTFF